MIHDNATGIVRLIPLGEEEEVNNLLRDFYARGLVREDKTEIPTSVDFVKKAIMIDTSEDDLDKIAKNLCDSYMYVVCFYGVESYKDADEFYAYQIVISNGKSYPVSETMIIGHDIDSIWDINDLMHIYGATENTVIPELTLDPLEEEEDEDVEE